MERYIEKGVRGQGIFLDLIGTFNWPMLGLIIKASERSVLTSSLVKNQSSVYFV